MKEDETRVLVEGDQIAISYHGDRTPDKCFRLAFHSSRFSFRRPQCAQDSFPRRPVSSAFPAKTHWRWAGEASRCRALNAARPALRRFLEVD